MRMLLPIGVVLILAGVGGSIGACYQSGRDGAEQVDAATSGPTGGVPAERADPPSGGPLLLAALSGLAMAAGVGCIAVGMGRWNDPKPSYTRPANPWNEQPAEKHEPPTGLV